MKKENRRVSVAVISFNGLEFIDDCLKTTFESLKGIDAEVIVIDNGSVDGTVELIETGYPAVKLLKNENNLGFARAVNQGFDAAIGKYIFLLNQDTRIVGNTIERLAGKLESDTRIGTVGPKFVDFDGRLQQSARAFPRYRDLVFEFTGLSYLFPKSRFFSRWKMGWFDHLSEREVDQPMGAALMVRSELLESIGGLDESFGIFFNDVDFCRRVKDSGFLNLYHPEAVVAHYVGGSTRKNKARMVFESHRSMFRYFRKYNRGILKQPPLYFWGVVLFITACLRAAVIRIFEK